MKACEMHLRLAFCVFSTTSARSSWSGFDQQLLTVNIVSIDSEHCIDWVNIVSIELVYKNIRCKSSPYTAHINNHIKHVLYSTVFNAFGISGV